jgi:chaperone protein EcpD
VEKTMKTTLTHLLKGLLLSALLGSNVALASVQVAGTRFVYPTAEREITVGLTNSGSQPALVQTWLDKGDPASTPGAQKLPFVIVPPLMRIEPGKGQTLRIAYIGGDVPTDRESVYWLNVLEVPPKSASAPGQNVMQIAFRSRLKLFLRPSDLPGSPEKAAEQVTWEVVHAAQGYVLRAHNEARYNISFSEVALNAGGQRYANTDGGMVGPSGTYDFPLKGLSSNVASGEVDSRWISDYGNANAQRYSLGQ